MTYLFNSRNLTRMWKYEYGVAYLNREKGKEKKREKGRYGIHKGEFVVFICDNRHVIFPVFDYKM
jgi:hypothetical protein